jgi:menaquinone-dependent protoporphyrinogen oxidase
MRTAIVYASKHGTTEKVAQNIQKMIGEDKAQLFNLKNNRHFDLAQFDQVVVGGSIHAGTIQKRIKKFVDQHRPELLEKKLGLFICCMHEQEAETEFNNAYPEILRSHAVSKKIMGGEFRFDKMNFIEKALVKKIAGINDSVSKIDEGKIQELVGEMEKG